MTSTSTNVWLITGCSSGFGRELALAARRHGDLVIATARKVEALDELKNLGCDVLALDVTASEDVIKQVVDEAHALYGRIDILVNNAGYTIFGAVEEASDKDVFEMFDTNVFGLLRVTRAVVPYMREKRSGTIANIGSGAGYVPFPTNGVYGATKFAVAGVSQALAQEVAHLGIEVAVIEPGMFRTNILSTGRTFQHSIADYEPIRKVFDHQMETGFSVPPCDPAKGAQAIVEALTKTGRCVGRLLPRRLPLGGDCLPLMDAELALREKEKNDWVDFVDPKAFAFKP
ncbi:hypothetical protein Poli38472_007583 [Pythium oligandrum]|uniref:Uncharacterized protein n=1 Tax=Pythium oligandrum TaxID=41045 RepID=A0A8K1CQE9_PYTOL|nr:hypothetical protein Poli38472_007583 [Pythium oligandrum]|eukprot:TMW67911.1 hypothetical protein Poli38472_007583 [Pythium oligandrum]